MDVQEPLCVGGRREAAHLALPLVRGLVRDLGTIVRVLGRVMGDQGHDVPMCDTVAAQLVSHETRRFLSLTLQESSKESPRRTPVPTRLDEDIDQVTVLVDRTPQILALTVDRGEDFVQKPRIVESTLSVLQLWLPALASPKPILSKRCRRSAIQPRNLGLCTVCTKSRRMVSRRLAGFPLRD